METAIKIDSLSISLDGQPVLKNILVDLPEGKIIGLLGPSGAGKTTLIRAIVGRLKIADGGISIFNMPAGSPELRKDIGYMTQSPSVYPDLTVRENVEYFAVMAGVPKKRADEVIGEVELTNYSGKLVSKLSGGQKSRVSLAVALLARPKLLVLDEPTVGVDPVLRQQLWELFKKLAGKGTSLLVTSHVMDEASRCQDLVLIRDGELLAHGSPKELCERTGTKSVEESFLKLVGSKA